MEWLEEYKAIKNDYDKLSASMEWAAQLKQGDLPFVIAFCGVFSSGKTSIINQFLGTDLPTGIVQVTKLVTRIRYGSTLGFYFTDANGNKHKISKQKAYQAIRNEVQAPSEYDEILVEVPHPFLKNGIEILDTPGFLDDDDLKAVTEDAVIVSDMVIMCFNSLVFGQMFEKEYIQTLKQTTGCVWMVLTRTDQLNLGDFEVIQESAKQLMEQGNSQKAAKGLHEKIFHIIADGPYKKMDALEEELLALAGNESLQWKIQQETNRRTLQSLRSDLMDAIAAQKQKLENLEKEQRQALEKVNRRNQQNELFRQNLQQTCNGYKDRFHSLSMDMLSSLEEKFREIEKTQPHDKFQELASPVARKNMANLLKLFCEEVIKDDVRYMYRMLDAITPERIDFYLVPKPKARVIQERGYGNVGRAVMTVVNFLTLDFTVDDGMVNKTVYNDYVKSAVRSVQKSLVQTSKSLLNTFLEEQWLPQQLKKNGLKPVSSQANVNTEQLPQIQQTIASLNQMQQSLWQAAFSNVEKTGKGSENDRSQRKGEPTDNVSKQAESCLKRIVNDFVRCPRFWNRDTLPQEKLVLFQKHFPNKHLQRKDVLFFSIENSGNSVRNWMITKYSVLKVVQVDALSMEYAYCMLALSELQCRLELGATYSYIYLLNKNTGEQIGDMFFNISKSCFIRSEQTIQNDLNKLITLLSE